MVDSLKIRMMVAPRKEGCKTVLEADLSSDAITHVLRHEGNSQSVDAIFNQFDP
jgi:hypothetical protein